MNPQPPHRAAAPANPKIYHILHVDRLPSVLLEGCLWSDREVLQRVLPGTTIGMIDIKRRRLFNRLVSHGDLTVGDCVPFYFCPRSIMLFLIDRANHPDLAYRGGQSPIIHLEADLRNVVDWAEANRVRWAFTLSNAGSVFFEDRCALDELGLINWKAVEARIWTDAGIKEGKQAEFLLERQFPWHLVERIGVRTREVAERVNETLTGQSHQPRLEIIPAWYY